MSSLPGRWAAVDFVLQPKELPPPPEAATPPQKHSGILRDLVYLAPGFRARIEIVLELLRGDGYEPLVWETIRTERRAEVLKKRGASRAGKNSMHCYGVAVDIICKKHKWQCHKHKCDFFSRLGEAVRKAGLHWGGSMWPTFIDKPHVQAIPARLQGRLRRKAHKKGYKRGQLFAERYLAKRPLF